MRSEAKWYLYRLMVGPHTYKVLVPFDDGGDFIDWLRVQERTVRLTYPARNGELIDLFLSIPKDQPIFLDTAFGKEAYAGTVSERDLPGLDNYQRPRATVGQRVSKGK